MALVEIKMPKMGESITEATILNWHKQVGDEIALDETLLEIATDKVDSELPSEVAGIVSEILYAENDVVQVGEVIAIITTDGDTPLLVKEQELNILPKQNQIIATSDVATKTPYDSSNRFYSPLVKNMAAKEAIGVAELDQIKGSGSNGRVTKKDLVDYLSKGDYNKTDKVDIPADNVEIIAMDRMRQLIADHMVKSKQTAPHVTSFLEIDVTNIVEWRNAVKEEFLKKNDYKITFTPIFIEAVAKAIEDFPMINSSVDGKNILVKKNINVGMATALPSGNLIVPVIKCANQYDLIGLSEQVNLLAEQARNGKLKPTDTQDGTFTLTNVGTFGNTMGTPIINQPQVAILSTGAINKKPAVLETEYGDIVAVRHRMFLSLSYDHRIVDGKLGGSFLRRVGDYLEGFDKGRKV